MANQLQVRLSVAVAADLESFIDATMWLCGNADFGQVTPFWSEGCQNGDFDIRL